MSAAITHPVQHPVQHVLVVTDFSDSADAVRGVAIQYARSFHARMHVVHAFAAGEVDVIQLLDDAVAQAGPDVPVSVAGTDGDPAEEILRYASRQPIDLIVVGTHGRTGVSRLIRGSVAERVVRGALCPVLVVPARRPSPVAVPASPIGVGGDDDERVAQPRPCLVCGTATRDLICEPCRARIGGALEHKRREERADRS
jgi:nucleotide-binding universal stress UspA family protein